MASPISALRWVLFSSIGFRIVSLGGMMLIIRLVDKDEFGLYRAVVTMHMICLTLLPLGLDTLVVREKAMMKRYAMASATALGVMGFVMAALSAVLLLIGDPMTGGVIGRWFELEETPGLVDQAWVLWVMPLIFLAQAAKLSIRSVHNARMNFRQISLGELGNGLITWIGGATVCLLYPSSGALLILYLLGELFEAWWFFRGQRFRLGLLGPQGLGIAWLFLKRNFHYCWTNTADLTLNNVASLIPLILIGTEISLSAATDYSVALQVVVLPTMLMAGALWRVSFPTLSGVGEEELQRRCLSITRSASAYIAPTVIWFGTFSATTVFFLAGEDMMHTAAPLVPWVSTYMVLTAIFTPISSLDMIRNKPHVGLIWNIFYTIGRVIILYTMAPDGLLATVAALAMFSTAFWVIQVACLYALLGAEPRRFFGSFGPLIPLQLALVAGYIVCLWITNSHLFWAPVLSLFPSALYAWALVKFFPDQGRLILRIVNRKS
ncbi:MAG: oligosaccharide flippase family protein [Candidatus Sumerlaeia bacterium]|nr:oligosaccharide flippase family protein [Candidatus Sumerlaeia bacterium]